MAITAPRLWWGGSIIESTHATLPLMSHAAQRGSLVFDVGSFHASRLFRARDHVARFLRSAKIVGLAIPFDAEALLDAAIAVVRDNALTSGLLRWSAFYDAPSPDLVPRDTTTHVAVAAQSLQDAPRTAPLAIAVYRDARKAAPEMLPVDAKAAAAYLGPMIARRRAIAGGFDDVVLVDEHGHVAEAPIANVFYVKDGELITPALGHVLPGITRDTVLQLAREDGIRTREEAKITVEDFLAADEAFLTSTSMPLGPIGRINDRSLPRANDPDSLTSRLLARVLAARQGTLASHASWLVPVG